MTGEVRGHKLIISISIDYLQMFFNWMIHYLHICPNRDDLFIVCINNATTKELAKYGITCSFDYHTSEHFKSPKKYSKPKASRNRKKARVKDDVDADVDVDANGLGLGLADQSVSSSLLSHHPSNGTGISTISQDPQPGADFGRSSFTSNSSRSRNNSSGFRITQDVARQKTL